MIISFSQDIYHWFSRISSKHINRHFPRKPFLYQVSHLLHQNCERLTLPYSQVNKIACGGHKGADRRPKASGSKTFFLLPKKVIAGVSAWLPINLESQIFSMNTGLRHNAMRLTANFMANILCAERTILWPFRIASCINNPKKWSWVRGDQGLAIWKYFARCIQIKEVHRGLLPNAV